MRSLLSVLSVLQRLGEEKPSGQGEVGTNLGGHPEAAGSGALRCAGGRESGPSGEGISALECGGGDGKASKRVFRHHFCFRHKFPCEKG